MTGGVLVPSWGVGALAGVGLAAAVGGFAWWWTSDDEPPPAPPPPSPSDDDGGWGWPSISPNLVLNPMVGFVETAGDFAWGLVGLPDEDRVAEHTADSVQAGSDPVSALAGAASDAYQTTVGAVTGAFGTGAALTIATMALTTVALGLGAIVALKGGDLGLDALVAAVRR